MAFTAEVVIAGTLVLAFLGAWTAIIGRKDTKLGAAFFISAILLAIALNVI